MLITDFSKIAYSSIHAFADDIKKSSPEEIENIIRHVIINSCLTVKRRFHREYGDLIIALDGKKNFRYDIFQNYKAGRKKSREDDGMPWHIIFAVMDKIKEEAKVYWPWKIVWSDFAEADDVMGVLTEDVANHQFVMVGLEEEPEPVLLDTRDHDMFQLHKHPNVKQWDSRERKFIKPEGKPEDWIRRFILTGCKGDGVPNVFSDINSFANGVRQKAAIASRMDPILKCKSIFDYDADPKIKERILQNHQLVCFDGMPIHVRDDIMLSWNTRTKASKMTMMKYLAEHRCKQLLECIDEF